MKEPVKQLVAVKKIPSKNPSTFWAISNEIDLLQKLPQLVTPLQNLPPLITLLITTRELLHLGAINKFLTKTEEDTLGKKILPLLLNAAPQPLTQKEFSVLKSSLVMTYILVKRYPDLVRLITPQSSSAATLKNIEPFEIKFLYLAEPALKYGAANCDGHAAVVLYLLLRSPQSKTLKNINIGWIGKHTFITIIGDKPNKPMVIDAYYNFVKPLPAALEFWKTQGYLTDEVRFRATIDNVEDFLKIPKIQEILIKLDDAKNSRQAGDAELNVLAQRFTVESEEKLGIKFKA